jgi:hypothetical protein
MSNPNAPEAAKVSAARAYLDMQQAGPVDLDSDGEDMTDEELGPRLDVLDAEIEARKAGGACPYCGHLDV